ncbi:MAG: hypothetical protein AB8B54_06410 [Sphingorhabdus sp.]
MSDAFDYAIFRIAPVNSLVQMRCMTWKTIRLELARTAEHPNGSEAYSYVFRVPLDDSGNIEPETLKAAEKRPVVRRFWPSEADQAGVVIASPKGWAFSYKVGEDDDEVIFRLKDHPLAVGEYLTITEPDGRELPFRVISCHE